jgi:transposase
LRSGARWHDLPERYGKYKSVHKRFVRWAHIGVWERIFEALVRDHKNQYLMLDSTVVRAHQQAARGAKRELRKGSGAFQRRFNSKIHLLCNQLGEPLRFLLTGGQGNDCIQAIALLGEHKAEAALADKGCDSDAIVEHIGNTGAKAVIPPKSNRKQQREYDKYPYKKRNRIKNAASPDSNSFADWPPGTTRIELASKPSSRSLAPASCFSQLSIQPKNNDRDSPVIFQIAPAPDPVPACHAGALPRLPADVFWLRPRCS